MKTKSQFNEILNLIKTAKEKVFFTVNTELINLYWDIGKYIKEQIDISDWGKSVVNSLSEYIQNEEPNMKGFSSQNLWRMKQFYETYSKDKNNNYEISRINKKQCSSF